MYVYVCGCEYGLRRFPSFPCSPPPSHANIHTHTYTQVKTYRLDFLLIRQGRVKQVQLEQGLVGYKVIGTLLDLCVCMCVYAYMRMMMVMMEARHVGRGDKQRHIYTHIHTHKRAPAAASTPPKA